MKDKITQNNFGIRDQILPISLIFISVFVISLVHILLINKVPPINDAGEYFKSGYLIADMVRGGTFLESLPNIDKNYGTNISRNPFYIFFIAACLLFWNDILFVYIVQACLLAISVALVYVAGCKIMSRKAAVISVAISALYTPFIVMTALTLTETLSLFLLSSLFYLLYSTRRRHSVSSMVLIGLILGSLFLTRNTFLPLIVILMLSGIIVRWWGKETLRSLGLMLAGLFFVIVSWLVIADKSNSPLFYGSGISHIPLYNASIRELDGWSINYEYKSESLNKILAGTGTEPTARDYRQAAIENYKKHTFDNIVVAVKRTYRFFAEPYDIYRHNFPLPFNVIAVLHKIAVLTAFLAIFMGREKFSDKIPVIVIIVSLVMAFSVTHIESRYQMPLLPILFLYSASGLLLCRELLRELISKVSAGPLALVKDNKHSLLALSSGVLLSNIYRLLTQVQATPKLSFVLQLLGILCVTLSIYLFCRKWFKNITPASGIAAFSLIILLFVAAFKIDNKNWHEWNTPLYSGDQASQEIYFERSQINVSKIEKAFIILDIEKRSGAAPYNLSVSLNGQEIYNQPMGPYTDASMFAPDTYAYMGFSYLRFQPELINNVRQWYYVPVNPQILDGPKAIVTVSIRSDDLSSAPALYLFGDYPYINSDKYYEGPAFNLTSIYRWTYDWEYRIDSRFAISSSSAKSLLNTSDTDLSRSFGIQSGNYRMRLLLIEKNGKQVLL